MRLVSLQNKNLAFLTAVMAILTVTASAQSFGSSGGDIGFVTTILSKGWLKNLITAGFAVATLIEIVSRWQKIFEGDHVLKNIGVIAAWVAMTIWWSDILKAILAPGA